MKKKQSYQSSRVHASQLGTPSDGTTENPQKPTVKSNKKSDDSGPPLPDSDISNLQASIESAPLRKLKVEQKKMKIHK